MRHTISVLVENKFGVLARISGLFSARGYNISSLAVSETLDPTVSCMTIVVDAKDEMILEQIKKQLNKLIDVITVTDFTKKAHVERELVLVKALVSPKTKMKLESTLKKFPAKIVEHTATFVIIEVMGDQEQIKNALEALHSLGVKELIRTGRIAMAIE
ncbi:MAG TPA: acetolactate synthase small subunit [Candidatus Omnitrophota bacterium]|nr:acetolactate synthase small subunit [Candidatus Omnitrophota bacterium]HPT07246.1 acetolactate synthase small subunit [Candidatus Omnitrophota bacterium]